MAEFVRAYSDDSSNTLISVSAAFAENAGLHTVKDDATDNRGRPLEPTTGYRKNTTTGGPAASKPEEASK